MLRFTRPASLPALLLVAAMTAAACVDCLDALRPGGTGCVAQAHESSSSDMAPAGAPCCDSAAAGEPREVVAVRADAGVPALTSTWNASAFDPASQPGARFEYLRIFVPRQPVDPLFLKTSVLLI